MASVAATHKPTDDAIETRNDAVVVSSCATTGTVSRPVPARSTLRSASAAQRNSATWPPRTNHLDKIRVNAVVNLCMHVPLLGAFTVQKLVCRYARGSPDKTQGVISAGRVHVKVSRVSLNPGENA